MYNGSQERISWLFCRGEGVNLCVAVISCRDLRARLEVAIERVLELVEQVERQKAVSSSSSDRRSSVGEEVCCTTVAPF